MLTPSGFRQCCCFNCFYLAFIHIDHSCITLNLDESIFHFIFFFFLNLDCGKLRFMGHYVPGSQPLNRKAIFLFDTKIKFPYDFGQLRSMARYTLVLSLWTIELAQLSDTKTNKSCEHWIILSYHLNSVKWFNNTIVHQSYLGDFNSFGDLPLLWRTYPGGLTSTMEDLPLK